MKTAARAVTLLALSASVAAAQAPSPSPTPYRSNPVDTAHGDRESLLLWPDGAPGALGAGPEDRPKITIYRYPGAGHSFFNKVRPTYDPAAAAVAATRIDAVLASL